MSCAPSPPAASRAPSAFSFAVSRTLGVVVVTAHGRLDAAGSATLRAALLDLIDGQGNLAVVLDAHDMTVVDPSLLHVLAAPAAAATLRGGRLTVARASEATRAAAAAAGVGDATVTPRPATLPPPSAAPNLAARRAAMAGHPSCGPPRPHPFVAS